MRLLIVFVMFFLFSFGATAQFSLMQKYETDTLLYALQTEKNDSIKTRIYYLLTLNFGLLDDWTTAGKYLKEASKHNKQFKFLKAVYPFYQGYAEWADTLKSQKLFLTAANKLNTYNTKEAFFLKAKAWRNIAIHYQSMYDTKQYYQSLFTAIPFAKNSGDSTFTGLLYQDIGAAFCNQLQFEKAEQYLVASINYRKNQAGSILELADAYYNAARNYVLWKDESKLPLAKKMLEAEYELLKKLPASLTMAELYMLEGMYYCAVKDYSKSIVSFNKGVAIAGKFNSIDAKYVAAAIDYQKYFTYKDQRDYRNALLVLLRYLNNNPGYIKRNALRVYFDLSETYAALNDKQNAYNWLKKYTSVNDSMYDIRLKNEVGALEVKFQTSEKQKRILELESEKKQATLTAKAQRLTNLLLGVACLLFLLLAGFIFTYYKKNKKISTQQLQQVQQQQELKITQAMLEGEERERARVARDLHDGLGGMLAGVKINLSQQAKMENQNLDVAIHQLDQSVSELRRIARNMMPESLLKIGLEASLLDLCEALSSDTTEIEFQPYNISKNNPGVVQANIYRIVQEVLSNAIRHAHASKIILQCSQNDNIFFIAAEDNGKGFDTNSINQSKGIGFNNLKNRVDYLKGKMDIASTPNEGTTINIELYVYPTDNTSHS